jgi:hypothetical protein
VALATLTAVYLAAYGDLIDRFFAFDDFAVLAASDGLHGPAGLVRLFVPWPSFAQYRPLTTTGYFWLARVLFGLDPRRWMAVQLAAHVLNALVVFGIARRLLASSAAGLAAALVYASAPGHALAVRWIAFTTIWGTVLVYFLGLWTWLRAGDPWRLPATLALFVVALLCSEHAVSFPLAVTAVAVLGQARRDWRRLHEKSPRSGSSVGSTWSRSSSSCTSSSRRTIPSGRPCSSAVTRCPSTGGRCWKRSARTWRPRWRRSMHRSTPRRGAVRPVPSRSDWQPWRWWPRCGHAGAGSV